MKLRFFWDFYGPHAEITARHFDEHLKEFFAKNEISLPSGVQRSGERCFSAYCDPPDVPLAMRETSGASDQIDHGKETSTPASAPEPEAVADRIGMALRPQRVERI